MNKMEIDAPDVDIICNERTFHYKNTMVDFYAFRLTLDPNMHWLFHDCKH